MTPQEYQRTQQAIAKLQEAGLYVDITPELFCVFKCSNGSQHEYDCWINCRTVGELEAVVRALAAAPRLAQNTDYTGVKE